MIIVYAFTYCRHILTSGGFLRRYFKSKRLNKPFDFGKFRYLLPWRTQKTIYVFSAISFQKATDRICAYEKSYLEAFNKLQTERWAINPSTHFTIWAQGLSISELKELCLAVKNFCETFECPSCKGLITINSDINLDPQNIYCDCREYSFSCIKKKTTP